MRAHLFSDWLRIWFLKRQLGLLGTQVIVDRGVSFSNPKKIYISDYCRIYRGAILIGDSNAHLGIFLATRTTIREYAHVNAYSGFIITGDNAYIGQGCVLSGHGGIVIGSNTMIGPNCSITSANHIFDNKEVPLRFQGETRRGIRIGANTWIASSVSILDGVTIGDNVVIAAGSVVGRDIPSWSFVGGNPAKPLTNLGEGKGNAE